MAGRVWIGTSGWSYPHWRERFYPAKLPVSRHFRFYADHFDTVELNNSFYRQPTRERFEAWAREAPAGFLFAVKGSRYVSHIKRMAVGQDSIDRIVESAEGLGDKLGPILFQFQANFRRDLEQLDAFLRMLPQGARFTLEFRHESWLVPDVFERLGHGGVALCVPDHPGLPQSFELTTNFAYVRMHRGAHRIGYARAELARWAERIDSWRQGVLDVYVYFNNDQDGHAIRDAETLRALLALETPGKGEDRDVETAIRPSRGRII